MDASELEEVHWKILKVLSKEGGLTSELLWKKAGIKKSRFYYHIDTLRAMDFVKKPAHGFYKLGENAPIEKLNKKMENSK